MALELERVPPAGGAQAAPRDSAPGAPTIVVGLINNMPDSALEGTESQFVSLLSAACGPHSVRLRVSSIPEVPRGPEARAKIAARYWPLQSLLDEAPDALIITGTEPKTPALADEPYWDRLVEVMDYAARGTISTVYSCLAAHAAALHFDGIERRRLANKRFGVFESQVHDTHALMRGVASPLHTPHSRWNDLPIDALQAAGYTILSQSADAGVDAFVKQRESLLVFFQGHPEYEGRTLLKEYQRDVGRYISGEYQQYPLEPVGYFGAEEKLLLADFARRLQAGELDTPAAAFPFTAVARTLNNAWAAQAARIYRNWLDFIAAGKMQGAALPCRR